MNSTLVCLLGPSGCEWLEGCAGLPHSWLERSALSQVPDLCRGVPESKPLEAETSTFSLCGAESFRQPARCVWGRGWLYGEPWDPFRATSGENILWRGLPGKGMLVVPQVNVVLGEMCVPGACRNPSPKTDWAPIRDLVALAGGLCWT